MVWKSPAGIFVELLARHDPIIREAFLRAIEDIRSSATLRVVVERLERGDIAGALLALQIEPEAFSNLERAIRGAYDDGGKAMVESLPVVRDQSGNRVIFRFAARDPASEAWLANHSSTLVTRITDDVREAVRVKLSEGLARGLNPTRTALDIVGRVDRATNRRTGGIIGLTTQQARAVENARLRLLSGEPALMREVLTMTRRDRRFDRTIMKAIREGRPLPDAFVTRWLGRYSDRLLKLRGDMIGLNETMIALEQSRKDAIRQQIEAGKVDQQDVSAVWKHTPQEQPRLQHVAMNGKSVPWGEDFVLPDGTRMKHPHDPNAPASHLLFCKCKTEYRIDFFGRVVRQYRAEAA